MVELGQLVCWSSCRSLCLFKCARVGYYSYYLVVAKMWSRVGEVVLYELDENCNTCASERSPNLELFVILWDLYVFDICVMRVPTYMT